MSGLIRGINQTIRQSLIDVRFSTSTLEFRFRVIVTAPQMMHDKILDATDALAAAGCDDASIGGHEEGMELLLERSADSLQSALSSAVADVEPAGYVVTGLQQQRETFAS